MAAKPSVIPILIPNIAWERFLKDASALSGHSPTFTVDNSSVELGDFAKYIVTLDELENGKTGTALQILGSKPSSLRHLFFSFLVNCSQRTLLSILKSTDLSVLNKKRLAVISGSLLQWQQALITHQNNKETRSVFNQCLSYFSKMGLGNLWDCYRKQMVDSETFLLEYKV